MMTLPRRYWHEMTSPEFDELDSENVIAIQQVAAVEQHGPHLPVSVDACINDGYMNSAVDMMPDDLPATILPMCWVGKSLEHQQFPGTLTFSAETLRRMWMEIGDSVFRAGIRKMVFVNSHGGQPQVMDIVARDLRIEYGMLVIATSWYSMGSRGDMYDEAEARHGIHGGTAETSMMLHLAGDLVKMDKAENFRPITYDLEKNNKVFRPGMGVGFGWQAQDLHPKGAAGDATKATAELGKMIIEDGAKCFVDLLQDVQRTPLSIIRDRDLTTTKTAL